MPDTPGDRYPTGRRGEDCRVRIMLYELLGNLPTLILIPCFKMETTRSVVFDSGYMVNLPSVSLPLLQDGGSQERSLRED